MISAVRPPARTRARLPRRTTALTGADTWFMVDASCTRVAIEMSTGCTATPTRPVAAVGGMDRRAVIQQHRCQTGGAGVAVPASRFAPVRRATSGVAGGAHQRVGGAALHDAALRR